MLLMDLIAQGPPGGAQDEDQDYAEAKDGFHAALSWMRLASWMAATGWFALHWATTSRAQLSHCPHWVATPSSNWMSSKSIPARAWLAISRSDTRRQTQTIMAELALAGG